jgi:plasmid stabilization system protein ParE
VILLQSRAKADLAEIWEFIADDSDAHADAFIDLIDQKFQVLAHQPSGDDGTNWPMV